MLISPLSGGGGTITDILSYYHWWKCISTPDILRTSIFEWASKGDERSITSIFQSTSEYQAADAPFEGEFHLIKIPDASGARKRLILIPYMLAISCIYIGYYWVNNDKIYWQKIDLNFTNINF